MSRAKKEAVEQPLHSDKTSAINAALASIDRAFGKGTMVRLGDAESTFRDIQVIPSGSIGLDIALGVGGFPRGRIVEVYGPESSGKTTIALHLIAEVQKLQGIAAFVDAEHALDVSYARRLGVRTDDLLVSQPDNGEQALEIVDTLVRSNAVDVIIVDSVAALVPKAEIEGAMGDSQVGAQARLMSQALRKLTASISKSNCIVLFINQLRMKIGVMFGSPETTTGGQALKFYASLRLDVRRVGALKSGEDNIGNRTRIKVVKNKVAAPFKQVEFDILYGEGICSAGDLIDTAVEMGLLDKVGAWYSLEGERLGQGREKVRQLLKDDPKLFKRLDDRVREVAFAADGSLAPAAAHVATTVAEG